MYYFTTIATWKRNKTGDLSTAGTTASTVIFRQDHIFVANVGDSTAVLAVRNLQPNEHPVKAMVLTKDHKPEDPEETTNIERLGKILLQCRNVCVGELLPTVSLWCLKHQ